MSFKSKPLIFAIAVLSQPAFGQTGGKTNEPPGRALISQHDDLAGPPAGAACVPTEECQGVDELLCQPARYVPRGSVFVFGGVYSQRSMRKTASIVDTEYDSNFPLGLGYQRYWWSLWDFRIGGEVGVAARFGDPFSVELWGGAVLRYDGLVIADRVKITPGITAGLSGVTATMGVERDREMSHGGDAQLLFYLGPEVAVSHTRYPNLELFYRLHHRSGAGGVINGINEGYNANVVGLRFLY